jgi:DnaD/phage-associated family protein
MPDRNPKAEVKFAGIPSGHLTFTSVPNVIFSELVPLLSDVAELKVVLHVFYLLSRKKGSPRLVSRHELSADATLMQSLEFKAGALKSGLERAVADGVLFQVDADGEALYLFNTPESRRVLARIEQGELKLGETVRVIEPVAAGTPNIFKLYEQQIGALTPIIADELKEAEQDYPPEVILDAFRIAAENNARSWKYVSKILSDWTRSHKYETTRRPPSRERRPTVTGKLAGIGKHK